MHATLLTIENELQQLTASVKATVPNNEPFNIAHGNGFFPGLTRDELAQAADGIIELISARGGDVLVANETLLADYPRRLAFLRTTTLPQLWGNPASGVPAFFITLDGLRRALEPAMGITTDEAIEASKTLKRLTNALRGVEARINDLGPRSTNLLVMVERIEHAYEAADQLPSDLDSLREARGQLQELLRVSIADRGLIAASLTEAELSRGRMSASEREAGIIIKRCDDGYRAQTSEGLASAFTERSRSLGASMWVWVVGLVIALLVGGFLGSSQLNTLSELLKDSKSSGSASIGMVWINLFLAVLSIGGPVWFAWVATKQIGQRFRLAEDYGYKASISKAYEGYRREAEGLSSLDPSFKTRLFSSALTRLEELPLRLVETDTHGSPWHELLSSDVVRDAVKTIPGFVDKITDLAKIGIRNKDSSPVPSHEPVLKSIE